MLLVGLLASTLPAPAVASEADSIVLVHDAGQELLTLRLRDELHALGWLVVEISEDGEREPLDALAERVHAFAGVHVDRSGELELWVSPVTGPAFREELHVDTADAEVAALRAVEVLRTRFLELGLTPPAETDPRAAKTAPGSRDASAPPPQSRMPPQPGETTPNPPSGPDVARSSPTPRPPLWIGIAPGAAASPGGLGSYPMAALELRILTATRWSFGGRALLPLLGRTVDAPQGSADVRWGLLEARAEYSVVPERSAVDLALMGGLGAVLVQMEGSAQRPYAGRSDAVVALAASAGTALSLPLSRSWALRAELTGGMAMPRPTVRFAGETAASWGRPFGVATLGVEVGIGR